jgi:hypothetical protein
LLLSMHSTASPFLCHIRLFFSSEEGRTMSFRWYVHCMTEKYLWNSVGKQCLAVHILNLI